MDLSNYRENKPKRFLRITWYIINHTVFRLLPTRWLKGPRHFLLCIFGAKISPQALIYSSSTIYAPWNLTVGRACIGPNTIIYNKDAISIGDDCVISQGVFMCTASHDITSLMLLLETAPIVVQDNVWIGANAFIGMGVTLGKGSIVGATASVYKDVDPWVVVGGNPAKVIKKREISSKSL